MISLQSLLNRLEVQAIADLEGEKRILGLLELLSQALTRGRLVGIEEIVESMKVEADAGALRSVRRNKLIETCAQHFALPPSIVTISSLCERIGPSAERLLGLRRELREIASKIAKVNRKLTAALRMNRRVISDALAVLLSDESGNPMNEQGKLINAEV